jgi:hypothetical protein
MPQMFKLMICLNVESKKDEINEQGKEKKPTNEMNEINGHVDHSKAIHEFINFLKQRFF